MQKKIPKLPGILLRLFAHSEYTESWLGDLEEQYTYIVKTEKGFSADLWYWRTVLGSMPALVMRAGARQTGMYLNYLKTIYRNFRKEKFYSTLNLSGLVIGLTSAILILLYITDELAYDKFHENRENIYRTYLHGYWGKNEINTAGTPPPTAVTLLREIPEITNAVRLYKPTPTIFQYEEKIFQEERVLAADSSFFDVFSFTVIEGGHKLLNNPNSIVLTESSARKYFGTSEALGKTLEAGQEKKRYTVTGVIEDVPKRSHLQFDMLLSIDTQPLIKRFDWSWIWLQTVTYVVLREDAELASVQEKINSVVDRTAAPVLERFLNTSFEEFSEGGGYWHVLLQPLSSVRLHSAHLGSKFCEQSDIKYIYIFGTTGFLILLLASINYMNLTTARAIRRHSEIGIRKVLGSNRKKLISQFLFESVLYSISAVLISLVLVHLIMPYIDTLSGNTDAFSIMKNIKMTGTVLMFGVFLGIASGMYPAFNLTSFQPAQLIRGSRKPGRGSRLFRESLVYIQFIITIIFIIFSIVIDRQLTYFSEKDLGFDKDNLVMITNSDKLGRNIESFENSLKSISGVISFSTSTGVPTTASFEDFFIPEGKVESISMGMTYGDFNFIETYGFRLQEGRAFSPEHPSDSLSILLNRHAAEQFGWDNPIGKTIVYAGGGNVEYTVIGVLDDFNWNSLRFATIPFGIMHTSGKTIDIPVRYITMKVGPGELKRVVDSIENLWMEYSIGEPVDIAFQDESISRQYEFEQKLGKFAGIYTSVAIVVACLGLFGLASYTAEQRKKEIGIRKVLGASEAGLLALQSKEILRIVILSNIIAWPVAFYTVSFWLQSFAYRISVSADIFIVSGLAAVVLSLSTIAYQIIRAAYASPITVINQE